VLKLNSDGTIAWQNTYGTTGEEYPAAVGQISDGGYVVTGSSEFSFTSDWVIKIDANGNLAAVISKNPEKIDYYQNHS